MRMIERALASDLDGKVEIAFRPEGLRCHLNAPLSAIAPESAA